MSPSEAGQVRPDMEANYSGTITVVLTATATVPFECSAYSLGAAKEAAYERAMDIMAQYRAATRTPWAGTDDWDLQTEVQP